MRSSGTQHPQPGIEPFLETTFEKSIFRATGLYAVRRTIRSAGRIGNATPEKLAIEDSGWEPRIHKRAVNYNNLREGLQAAPMETFRTRLGGKLRRGKGQGGIGRHS